MTTTFVACATLIVGAHSGKKAAGGKNMEIGALVKSSGSICAEAATSSFGGSMLKMSFDAQAEQDPQTFYKNFGVFLRDEIHQCKSR